MAPHSSVLHGESRGRGSLVGCHLWGRTESDTTEVTQPHLAAACISIVNYANNLMAKGQLKVNIIKILFVNIYFSFLTLCIQFVSTAALGFIATHGLFLIMVSGGLLSSCRVQASYCNSFSCCGVWALECRLSTWGAWAQLP